MKTLSKHRIKIKITSSFYHKNFSTLTHVVRPPDSSIREEGTQVSELHTLLQICARNRASIEGKSCHAKIIHFGSQQDTLTSNILLNTYSKCGLVHLARKVFDEMPEKSIVSWNTMIGTYSQNSEEYEALSLFMQMQREGNNNIQFTEFTVSSVLCACAAKSAVFECKQLHSFTIKTAILFNVFVGTALLDVYSKCGLIKEATRVFECMTDRSTVTWSSMVAGYVRNELYEEALRLFRRAQAMGLKQSQYTISSVICACANIAALIEGKQVHALLCKTGFEDNLFIISSLIDMYGKCGSVREAYVMFSSARVKCVVLWNAMISGFAKHARSTEAMILFEKMQQLGIHPNEVTYVSLLSACSHMGLVEKGEIYFNLMKQEHEVKPNVFHYSCMIDIFGRAGFVHKAHEIIKAMPFDPTAAMWGSLLAACRVHGNLELAEVAAKHLFELEPDNAGNHVLLSNIYAANKKWDEVAKSRKVLKETDVKKVRGTSWIEVKDKVHTFMVGERNHPRITEIYLKLDELVEDMKKMKYKPGTEHDLHDVVDSEKQELLRHHSEKLAFTFGYMCLPSSAPIRIMKNLRICGDCHSFMKVASSITEREIVVRDINRFHHFRNGVCTCGEFW